MGPFIVSLFAAAAAFAVQVLLLPRDLNIAPTVCLVAPQHAPSPRF